VGINSKPDTWEHESFELLILGLWRPLQPCAIRALNLAEDAFHNKKVAI
jgi:hypothetical protein